MQPSLIYILMNATRERESIVTRYRESPSADADFVVYIGDLASIVLSLCVYERVFFFYIGASFLG